MIAGAALGGVAVQGVNAQLTAKKAYTISELEVLDAQAALKAAGGRSFNTGGGKVVGMEGPSPPKRVGLTEWDSLEKAEAFFKSKAFTDLPDREKAIKTIRRYAVEVAN